ncbi:MAG: hypothetical protein OXU51_02765 [Candidatus Poribacteria bacterium]|nr:hypothetical protein [Candidatus Poribacteria bacterium]
MNNQANSNKSNSVDSFQRILSLAEFGVKRMEERRTVEFRIFISYITLLVLALYQLSKRQNSIHDFFKSIIPKDSVNLELWEGIILYALVLCIHIIYVIWQVGIGIAMDNDSYRRNFYLKKAEEMSGHPLKYENFNSDKKIKPITNYLQQFKYLWIIWTDWSRILLVVTPTLLFIIVVHLFFKNIGLENVCFSGINVFMSSIPLVVSVMQKRCKK